LNQNLKKSFSFSQRSPKSIRPKIPWRHVYLFFTFPRILPCRPETSDRSAQLGSPGVVSFLRPSRRHRLPTEHCHCRLTSPMQHLFPLPWQNESAPLPLSSPQLLVSPPHFLPARNGFAIEAPLSRRRLLLDRSPPVVPQPIKAALEHHLHTTFPVLASAHSIRTRIALPPRSNPPPLRSAIAGLPLAPHCPPSLVETPEASSSFSPTVDELPLTGAALSLRSGEPFGHRRPWYTMDS
jgi:hypothetical protein